MHIAVTGASGRIGNVVVRQLIQAGYQVRVLLRRPLEQTIAGAYQWFDQYGYL